MFNVREANWKTKLKRVQQWLPGFKCALGGILRAARTPSHLSGVNHLLQGGIDLRVTVGL